MTTWIEINTLAYLYNVRQIRESLGEAIKLFAVVKANAYGHGLELAADALWRAGVDGFVVTETRDALMLSERYFRVPVLLLNPPELRDLSQLIKQKVRFSGGSADFLESVKTAALRQGTKAIVHLELETGMHRFGISNDEALHYLREVQSSQSPLVIEGLFTHLYDITNQEVAENQMSMVGDLLLHLQQQGMPIPMVHILSGDAYADASFNSTRGLYDAIRVGRLLYGAERRQLTTQPVMTWKTRIVHIMKLKPGETVGYHGTFTTDRERVIGMFPVGYSEGLDRRLSNKGFVLIQGKRCQILGRVCMNNTMVDLSPVLMPTLNDEVVLLGQQGDDTIWPEEMAEWAGTIGDEILARLPQSTPRVKVK